MKWNKSTVPPGRMFALCYYCGTNPFATEYSVGQWEPKLSKWLFHDPWGGVSEVTTDYIWWRPLPSPPVKDRFVDNRVYCLEG